MPEDYYQSILYPLQDKILRLLSTLPVDFYLTGGTALSRAYLNHRYSDDLDFFLNHSDEFKKQVEVVLSTLEKSKVAYDVVQSDQDFVRLLINEKCVLKIDLINDVEFRSGAPAETWLYRLTDTPLNILSNKITALSRLEPKDVVDIVYIALHYSFTWLGTISDASQKDLWVSPVEAARILDQFPAEKLSEIKWINNVPDMMWFQEKLRQLISDLLQGKSNSLIDIT